MTSRWLDDLTVRQLTRKGRAEVTREESESRRIAAAIMRILSVEAVSRLGQPDFAGGGCDTYRPSREARSCKTRGRDRGTSPASR